MRIIKTVHAMKREHLELQTEDIKEAILNYLCQFYFRGKKNIELLSMIFEHPTDDDGYTENGSINVDIIVTDKLENLTPGEIKAPEDINTEISRLVKELDTLQTKMREKRDRIDELYKQKEA